MSKLFIYTQMMWTRAFVWTRKALGGEKGATVAEYALVLVLIAVALITVLGDLGEALQERIQNVIDRLPSTPS